LLSPTRRPPLIPFAIAFLALVGGCGGNGDSVVVGATTSLQDSGILEELIAAFEDNSGYEVRPVVAGTGQVLELAGRGELDITLTHSPADEALLIEAAETIERRTVMQNSFVLVGPKGDPAGVSSAGSLAEALAAVAAAEATFISRGDESGTHVRELSAWEAAGIVPGGNSWYQESGVGQGQNLVIASDKAAYALTDTATFIVLRDRLDLVAYFTDPDRPNVYSAMLVNPDKHPEVADEAARALLEFLVSAEGRRIIAEFGREEYGLPLFELPSPD